MEEVGGFKINAIALARIKSSWERTKATYSKRRQGEARASSIRGQKQFETTSSSRKKALAAVAKKRAEKSGEGEYEPSQDRAKQAERDTRELLKRATRKKTE